MYDLFIDGAAKRVWETQIPFERRNNLILRTEIVCMFFKFPGGGSWNHHLSEFIENQTRYAVGFP